MSKTGDDVTHKKDPGSPNDGMMIAIDVAGKDPDIWVKRSDRFHQRLLNSVKKLFGQDIPASATANIDLRDTVDAIAEGVHEKLKEPLLANVERQASVKVKLAEAKEKEANARRIGLEADKLEIELESERVHESQKMIDLLIQRGELTLIEQNGETIFIYKKC
jgi:hypothetical protein